MPDYSKADLYIIVQPNNIYHWKTNLKKIYTANVNLRTNSSYIVALILVEISSSSSLQSAVNL